MSSTAKVIRPDIAPGRRVLAISDIHGNLPFFCGVLEKARFSPEDVLILVGDLFEKGEESLPLLRYLMELSQTHTVYPLCGNCDHLDLIFLEGRPGIDEALWPVFRTWDRRSLILQMGAELGLHPQGPEDLPRLRAEILANMPQEVAYLRGMAHILQAGRYIFVHGGIPGGNLKGLCLHNYFEFLKYDRFMETDNCFEKYVVVGHWPVCLYDNSKQNFNPIFDRRRKIISIDGGCGLKKYGQLNIIAIPDIGCGIDEIVTYSYDGLPAVMALEDQRPSEESLFIKWGDNTINKLATQGDFTYAEHQSTGKKLWIHNDFIYGEHYCNDYTDYVLPVNCGEKLSFIKNTSRGCIVKKDGVVGWYFGRFRPIE